MFSMFSILSSNSFSLYYVSLDNKDRSDQTDRRKGNRNLCAAVFSFFHSTAIPTMAAIIAQQAIHKKKGPLAFLEPSTPAIRLPP
jgi:hypothetical protein